MNAFVGTGITITGGPSAFVAEIVNVTPPALSRKIVATYHQGSTQETSMPGKLLKYEPLKLEIAWKGDYPTLDVPGTYTITYPKSGSTPFAFTGYIYKIEPKTPLDDRAMAAVEIAVQSVP